MVNTRLCAVSAAVGNRCEFENESDIARLVRRSAGWKIWVPAKLVFVNQKYCGAKRSAGLRDFQM